MLNWSDRGHLGGRTLQVVDLAEALGKLGHEVYVLDARAPHSIVDQLVAEADLLHVHGGVTPLIAQLPRLASWVSRRRLRPIVCTLHGWHYRRLADRIERTIERLGLYGCAHITAPNSRMIAQLPLRLRRRAQVVPNGIVPVGSTLRVTDNDVHVMWLGRVCRAKGIETALEAFLRASRLVPNVKLHLVGPLEEPDLQGLLSATADQTAGRIVLWGAVQRPWQEVPADILLHTALYDACPRDILEAMSAGTAVVSTAVGGIPEVINHNTNGFLTDASNVPKTADHLVRLATDTELRNRLSKAALARFEAHYRIDTMAERFSNLYKIAFRP